MVSISQTPWTGYTEWTTATTGMIAARSVWGDIFGELTWLMNGGITADNFGYLVNLFYTPGRYWSKLAIKEHKVQFDPQDGHDHSGGCRTKWSDNKITKKNLDPSSARVVWTALDGSVFSSGNAGMTVIGGVRILTITPGALSAGSTPGGVSSTTYTVGLGMPDHFVFFGYADYGRTESTVHTDFWPFATGVMPVVVANFLIPLVFSGTVRLAPAFSSWGRWGIEMVPLGHSTWTDGQSPGFWIWHSGFSMQSPQTGTTLTIYVVVPWMAFGPSKEKVISWV